MYFDFLYLKFYKIQDDLELFKQHHIFV